MSQLEYYINKYVNLSMVQYIKENMKDILSVLIVFWGLNTLICFILILYTISLLN